MLTLNLATSAYSGVAVFILMYFYVVLMSLRNMFDIDEKAKLSARRFTLHA
jgi:hypothetical protein